MLLPFSSDAFIVHFRAFLLSMPDWGRHPLPAVYFYKWKDPPYSPPSLSLCQNLIKYISAFLREGVIIYYFNISTGKKFESPKVKTSPLSHVTHVCAITNSTIVYFKACVAILAFRNNNNNKKKIFT